MLLSRFRTKSTEVNPNVCGKESSSSVLSTGSESSSSGEESDDIEGDLEVDWSGRSTPESVDGYVSFKVCVLLLKQWTDTSALRCVCYS